MEVLEIGAICFDAVKKKEPAGRRKARRKKHALRIHLWNVPSFSELQRRPDVQKTLIQLNQTTLLTALSSIMTSLKTSPKTTFENQ